jgi:hypothetical protein
VCVFPVKVEGDDVYLQLPPAEELDAVLATEKTCNGSCHAKESAPKKGWTHRKAKVPELLSADPNAKQFRRNRFGLVFRRDAEKIRSMSKTTELLEKRLARVEKDLAQLREVVFGQRAEPWYQQIVGSFAGDEAFAEIIRLGRLIRTGKKPK